MNIATYTHWHSKPPHNHKVTILWGEMPEDGQKAITYEFATKEELSAFIFGAKEGACWIEYEEVEEGYVHNIPEKDRITTVLEVPKK